MSSLLTVLHKILILHYSRAARGYEDLFCLPKLIHVQSRVCIVILGQLGHPVFWSQVPRYFLPMPPVQLLLMQCEAEHERRTDCKANFIKIINFLANIINQV